MVLDSGSKHAQVAQGRRIFHGRWWQFAVELLLELRYAQRWHLSAIPLLFRWLRPYFMINEIGKSGVLSVSVSAKTEKKVEGRKRKRESKCVVR